MAEKKDNGTVKVSFLDELITLLEGNNGLSSGIVAAVIAKLKQARAASREPEAPQAEALDEKPAQTVTAPQAEALDEKPEQDAVAPQAAELNEKPEQLTADKAQDASDIDLPLDWDGLFDGNTDPAAVHADNISDGLILSLSNLGRVDIEYIASVTGEDMKTVICQLKGAIYQNPETWEECYYKGWETAEEYLSGNMVSKWKAAKAADWRYRGYFADNVKAIEAVLPPSLSADQIYITLGSPWVPADVIDDFICYMLKIRGGVCYAKTVHDAYTGTWEISDKAFYKHRVGARATYGTERLTALYILERTLNMKTVSVTDEVSCSGSKTGKKRVVNQAETVAALAKQQKMIKDFQCWVWKDPDRRERLETIFENNFGCVRRRRFNGSFLQFPTMARDVTLYPYQKDAVARILFSPNTLLAHDVGSGKTYIMIAAGMELRRMGLAKKNLYVVPNNLVGQWKSIFLRLYPQAKLLCVEPKNFTPEKREGVLKTIRDNSFDGIIMAYSCFEQIELSREYHIRELEETHREIKDLLRCHSRSSARLKKRKEAVEKALLEALGKARSGGIFFDELGISRLFVDEAHNYKNVPLDTKTTAVLGISATGSKKCRDMMDKVHMVQKTNGGGGVVMATGTPITNSITDAFILQKYLQSGELAMLDLQSFDSWIGMFAERVTEFEVDVDTSSYRLATRFAKFHNLPELTSLFASVADFHQVDAADGVPETDGYRDALLDKTPEFTEYLKTISARADDVRSGLVDRTQDNMLKITTDGRKAALDLRLVDPSAAFTYRSKVARCAENVADIYFKTQQAKSTQLIFCDTSTPKKGFNIYDELARLLRQAGIPEQDIAYIHNADTERKRQTLFAKVRAGQVRILLGSTFKLGLGVNVQDKLIAIHHLDVPWRPADMTQREGRILRQGNENKQVQIFRYITEGSFDAYSWQLLETKQRFIVGLLSGSIEARSGSDIEDTVLNYAEVKALAVGDPLVKKRVETANELTRLLSLQKKAIESHIALERELQELPGKISRQKLLIHRCEADAQFYAAANTPLDKDARRELRKQLFDAVAENVLAPQETTLLQYQGFDVILPSGMTREKPYLWLQREGRYYVELGDVEKGYLVRLDHVLEGLPRHREMLENNLEDMQQRHIAIGAELQKKEDHTDQIAQCRQALEALDKKLGVKNS